MTHKKGSFNLDAYHVSASRSFLLISLSTIGPISIKLCRDFILYMESVHARDNGREGGICKCSHVCTTDSSYLFGITRAIQDLCMRNIEFLVAERYQITHSG